MTFFELKDWLKAHDLTFELESYGACFKDTILIYQNGKLIYEGDYNPRVDYNEAVRAVESALGSVKA